MNEPKAQSLFEQLGGESKLREIIDAFIDRVFEDRMIGFFFHNANRARIKEMEYQLIANFLGADIEYKGKPLQQAHEASDHGRAIRPPASDIKRDPRNLSCP